MLTLLGPFHVQLRSYLAFSHYITMPNAITSKDKRVEVIALFKAGHILPFITHQTGVTLRTVQRLVKSFRDAGDGVVPC